MTKTKIRAILFLVVLLNSLMIFNYSFLSTNTGLQVKYIKEDIPAFNETNAYQHIKKQLEFGFRVPGTVAHNKCSEWIIDQMGEVSTVTSQNFVIKKEGQPSYNCTNILGKMNTEKRDIVILGAHWDSRNVAEKDEQNRSTPIPGANDGASGVAVLIELARILNQYKDQLDCQIWFLFIDAEDQGYSNGMFGLQGWDWSEGAFRFVESIEEFYDPLIETFECFILLDMVGGTNLQFIQESRADKALLDSIFNIGQALGYEQAFPENPKEMTIIDDHVAFYNYEIPVIDLIIDFISGEWSYHHTHGDNLENIDPESLKITGKTIEVFLKKYYHLEENKDWQDNKSPLWPYFAISGSLLLIFLSTIIFIRRTKFIRSKNKI